MNVLIVDSAGAALNFALRCQQWGHSVRWFVRPQEKGRLKNVGEGMVEKVDDWQRHVNWSDLIVLTDNVHYLKETDELKRQGHAVFGPSYKGAKLELDRELGQGFLADHGIEIIPSELFTDYDKAEEYVLANMDRYVSKPSGDADKALSYVSKSPADMIYMLRRWKEKSKIKAPFILQKFVPGIEIAVGGWLGANGFSKYWFENFEHKKLMNGDKGPNTGEQGTVARYVEESRLAEQMLLPCEKELVKLGITGYVDVNCIMDDSGRMLPLEWTIRPGWPTMNLQSCLHRGDPVMWMWALTVGEDFLNVDSLTATGVILAIPDYPYSQYTAAELQGFPIYHLEDVDPNHVQLCEVKMGEAPVERDGEIVDEAIPVSEGDYILLATGVGNTVVESSDAAYAILDTVEMPNSAFYRTDIGDRLKKELPKLQEHGYCTDGWIYE